MKAKSTIAKQMARLWRIARDKNAPRDLQDRCYDMYHALKWVTTPVNWTPASFAEKELADAAAHK